MKEAMQLMKHVVVPRLCSLVGKSVPVSIEPTPKPDKSIATTDDRNISGYFVRQLLDEVESSWVN